MDYKTRAGCLLASIAIGSLLVSPLQAQVAPSGGVLYLDDNTPSTKDIYTNYSTTVTATTTGLSYALFAFREAPRYFYFDDASITAFGSNVNLLTNPGFEDGSTPSTLSGGVEVPVGWGTIYQTGTVPGAPGTVSSAHGAHSGSYVWYDGSVQTYDGIYQTINTVAGQQYLISFSLKADNDFRTPDIEMATYFGACGTANGSCATSFGNGFTVSQPSAPTIDTTDGDLAANRFSLASPAATGSTVQFQGGTLVMQGGSFAGNIVSAPVTLTASNGTVDTTPASGGFSGVVSGPGSLIITGGNTFSLTGANTYTGGTTLSGGTLLVSTSTAADPATGVISSSIGAGLLTFDGGTLQAQQGGIVSFDNAVQVTGNGGTIDSNGGSLRLNGTIGGSGALSYVATGGVFTGNANDATSIFLRGSNTYTGGSTIENGASIQAVAPNALGVGSLAVSQGGIVALAGFDQQVTTLTGNGLIIGGGAFNGAQNGVTIETLTVQSGSFGGQIQSGNHFISDGSGGTTVVDYGDITLRKVSDGTPSGGTLLLSGDNSYGQYGGRTLLEGGTIAVASNSALGTSTLAMSDGTTLQLAASLVALQNDMTLSGTDTVDTQDNAGGLGLHGVISGTGTLVKIGSTGLGLYNANLYSGGTILDAGHITLHNDAGLGTGALTFNGGQLTAGTDGLTVANPATLVADGTIDTRTFSLNYAGAISGAGQFVKIGTGTLALTNVNSYSGGTALNAGTLAVGNSSALGSGTLTINAGTVQAAADGLTIGNAVTLAAAGTLDTQANALTLSGGIAGPGSLTKTGTGTLTLTGPSTYTGGTEVLAGTVELGTGTAFGTGPIGLDDGTQLRFVADGLTLANAIDLRNTDPTIDTGSGFETISGPITGPGQLTKIGSGTLDLTGTNTNTGATEVAGGSLLVDGALVSSTVTVDDGATLGGRGSVASVIIGSGGRLAPSASQALTITGNLQLLTGSSYEVTVNADGTSSKLAVGGSVDLGGAALSVLAGSGTFRAHTYTLLTAGALMPGTTFGTVTTATSLALLRPQVNYDYAANDVTLTLNPVDFRTIAATSNQTGVAGAIQNLGPGNGLYDAVVGLDAAQARQAFNAASGVTHANTQAVITGFARTGTTLLLDRLWDVSGSGLSAQQVLNQFAPDRLPALVRCYGPTPDPVATPAPPTYTAWGEAFGTFGHTDASPNAGALDRSLGGFILGIDTPLDRIGGDKWRAGLAGGYTSTSFKSPLDGGSGTVQSVFGSLYGGARYGAVDLRLGTVAGGTFVDARRDVAFGGAPLFNEVERSHNSGYTVQTFGEVGYRIPAGAIVVEPIAGAAYLHSHQDGFAEKGGVAALTVSAQDTDLGTTTLGIRAEAQPFTDQPIVVHTLLGWQHAIGDVSPATTLAFASAPLDTFSVIGTPIDRDALAAEAALDYRVSALLDVGLTYVGQVGATAADHSIKGRVEYRF